MDLYNKIKSLESDSNYPFNLINNLKHNILETKKEIDLEYIKSYYKDDNKLQSLDNVLHKPKSGGLIKKEILIYLY